MADKKISALTSATTPLAGTEVLPIVQSGSTVKVAISNLTAGRAVATGALTVAGTLSASGITTLSDDLVVNNAGGVATFNSTNSNGNKIILQDAGVTVGYIGATGTGSFLADSGAIARVSTTTSGAQVTGTLSATSSITSAPTSGDASVVVRGFAGSSSFFQLTEAAVADRWTIGVAGSSDTLQFRSGSFSMSTGTQRMTLTAAGTLSGGTSGTGYSFSGTAPAGSLTLNSSGSLAVGHTSAGGATFGAANGANEILQVFAGFSSNLNLVQNYNQTSSVYVVNENRAASYSWKIGTASAAMTLDSSGNLLVGITTNTNSSRIFVLPSSNTSPAFACQGVTGDVGSPAAIFGKFDNDTTTSQVLVRFTVNNNTAGSGQITANGANTAAFGSYSDQRLKKNIIDLPPQLENIMALRPVEFDYIESEGGGHQTGFIAQNMESVYPDVVGERKDGMKMIAGWSKTEARLVKAIQEQQALITQLTARITALETA